MHHVPRHLILLGDSIFDNAVYVPDGPPVIAQTREALPDGWHATLLAVDGVLVEEVPEQMARLPADATHLVMSAGGNNALSASYLVSQPAVSVSDALAQLHDVQENFRSQYQAILTCLLARGLPLAVCTVYDAVPGLGDDLRTALSLFNDIITRAALAAGVPIIDLRGVCDQPEDYSLVSPIEPSELGGAKIAQAVAAWAARA